MKMKYISSSSKVDTKLDECQEEDEESWKTQNENEIEYENHAEDEAEEEQRETERGSVWEREGVSWLLAVILCEIFTKNYC